jgi:peptide/nickel transport system ATP-binding protein
MSALTPALTPAPYHPRRPSPPDGLAARTGGLPLGEGKQKLLEVCNLHLEFRTSRGVHQALMGVSFEVQKGEIFGLVGETGCGKTVTGLSILRLLPRSARIPRGQVIFEGNDLLALSKKEMEEVRGGKIAMIFQDPSSSLNPVFTIGSQIERVVRQHLPMNAVEARKHALEMLEAVGLPDVERILASYPHQLSGGMQQRVMIAMALSCRPQLLIADEPTTALDVTIQAQILRLLRDLQQKMDFSVILITHNLGIVAQTCDRLAVLYAGSVAESGTTRDIFNNPQHPYTRGLMNAIPKPGSRGKKMSAILGTVPSDPGQMVGCAFAPRCEFAYKRCTVESPQLFDVEEDHKSACFLVVDR